MREILQDLIGAHAWNGVPTISREVPRTWSVTPVRVGGPSPNRTPVLSVLLTVHDELSYFVVTSHPSSPVTDRNQRQLVRVLHEATGIKAMLLDPEQPTAHPLVIWPEHADDHTPDVATLIAPHMRL